jgi:UPF0716 protein FxsA
MVVVLIVVFLVVPLLELGVILWVGSAIGVLPTLAFLLAVSVCGGWLVRRIGFGVWQRARRTLDAGQIPGQELLDGSVVLGAGALLLVPGFVTDVVGLVLLVPIVRRFVARRVLRRFGVATPVVVRTRRVESTWSSNGPADVVTGELVEPPRELER